MVRLNTLMRHATVAMLSGLLLSACTNQSPRNSRTIDPPQCVGDEQFICVGGDASRLHTELDPDVQFCHCGRVEELPQMRIGNSTRN